MITEPPLSRPDLEITSWTDLAALPDAMDLLADQLSSIARYARRWACQREGFDPSPLCLLRPLALVMDRLADSFHDLERVGLEDWADLHAGVVATASDLAATDAEAAGRLVALA